MFQCERCCKMINSKICPDCGYDNTEYINQLDIILDENCTTDNHEDFENDIIALGGQLGPLGGPEIRIKSQKTSKQKKNKNVSNDNITLIINKKLVIIILSVIVILLLLILLIHRCDNCGIIFIGKEYHSFGGNTCKNCYHYFTGFW